MPIAVSADGAAASAVKSGSGVSSTSSSSSSIDYKAMVASLPGASELLSALSTLDLQQSVSSSDSNNGEGTLSEKSSEELVKEVLVGRQKAHILESSFMVSCIPLPVVLLYRCGGRRVG